MTKSHVLIIIPCFNEQDSIEILLTEIKALSLNYVTLVVDDGSSDETFKRASQLSKTVRLIRNLGIGGAVQTGIRYARDNNFDFCVQIDGDGQHPPGEIVKLLKCSETTKADVVIGSRYLSEASFRSTRARRTGSKLIAWTLKTLFHGAEVTDPTSGMRLLNRKAMHFFAEHYPHDFPEPISLAWSYKQGLRVAECSVLMRSRSAGESTIKGLKPLAYMARVIGYLFFARLVKVMD